MVDETITLGFTALHIASSIGPDRTDIADALCRAGANVNLAAEEGVTPVMAAAQHGHAETLRVLLEAGGDPNQPGEELCMPIHVRRAPLLERKLAMHTRSLFFSPAVSPMFSC